MTLIKICGISTAETLDHCVREGADMVGFVHFEKSPRHIDLETMSALAALGRDRIETVALLVDPDDRLVARVAGTGVGWLQLHGRETPDRVAEIKAFAGLPVIKAVGIGEAEDLAAVTSYHLVADRLILDARPPAEADRPGGLGARFDWSLLDALDPAMPFMLSGGLDCDNVAEAVSMVRPFGLDVSSGVESAPGQKVPGLISRFIANARALAPSTREPR
ncbi:phosphoribosylanthranilate isomerase [Pelagibacterium montanilacus]|uniref:phosphoribosylanthranilate isomerase n=1 Tax=Pelagibacterium montanilacus TaxID=2185280 RepID=UPI000F8E24D4|nr:phosphoribosylanthranilate isomerase [Pelagibacterium montanilacus]